MELFRARKALGWPAFALMQLVWLPIGLVPFLLDTPGKLAVFPVIAFLGVHGALNSLWVTTSNTWMRDLVPPDRLASYFGRRLAMVTIAISVIGLAGGFFVRWWEGIVQPGEAVFAFSFLLVGGVGVFGTFGVFAMSRAVEPMMPPSSQSGQSPAQMLLAPLRDPNYFRLIKFLFVWSLISNLAIPFFAIYMLKVIGLWLPVVMGLTALGQISNVLFVRVGGASPTEWGAKRCCPCRRRFTCWSSSVGCSPCIPSVIF